MPRPVPDPHPLSFAAEPNPSAPSAGASRRELLETGGAELARAKRYGRPLSVIALKLRDAGEREDAIARDVIETMLRAGADRTVHVEPGRYVAVLPETALAGAIHLAARLQHRLLEHGLRARAGFAAMHETDERFTTLFGRAQAMAEGERS